MIEYDPKNTYLMTDVCKIFYKALLVLQNMFKIENSESF